jgi:hypothetical protein
MDVSDLYKDNCKLLRKEIQESTEDGKICCAHGLVAST